MPLSTPEMDYIRDLVYRKSAIVVEASKGYLVESRLAPLAREEGFASIEALIEHLRARAPEALRTKVVEAMTTNETSFFRDQHPFKALESAVLPSLRASRSTTRSLRIWCAACSTGQEPYSIAMTLREAFPELATWDVRILATDMTSAVLSRAREGLFSQLEVNRGLPATLLVKYFERSGTNWQAKPTLRSLIEFKQLNLLDPWPTARFDVVFMRNVLIYFDLPTKQAILSRVERALARDGYLFLGGAETTMRINDSFQRVQFDKAVFYRPGDTAAK